MTTECIIQDIELVRTETSKTLESYESTLNVILDVMNRYKGIFDDLKVRLEKVNSQIGNVTGNDNQVDEIISISKESIGILRRLIGIAKRSRLYSGYKTSLHELSLTVDDFEEHISDFKFRHDTRSQSRINEILSGFSLSL